MRIIVISDTHQNYLNLKEIISQHLNADLFLHLGDGESECTLLLMQFPEITDRFHNVKGNCDFESLPLELSLDLMPGHRLFATHGHRYGVKSSLPRSSGQHEKMAVILHYTDTPTSRKASMKTAYMCSIPVVHPAHVTEIPRLTASSTSQLPASLPMWSLYRSLLRPEMPVSETRCTTPVPIPVYADSAKNFLHRKKISLHKSRR